MDLMSIYDTMIESRLEKLPIVDDKNNIIGLACEKDLRRFKYHKTSNVNN